MGSNSAQIDEMPIKMETITKGISHLQREVELFPTTLTAHWQIMKVFKHLCHLVNNKAMLI
jgi:hypothetical protein